MLAAQEPLSFTLSDTSAASLAHLSQEPILIKQAQDGLRVQLDNRPLVPIAILTDLAAAAALREIVAGASRNYGARWTALVIPSGDGSARSAPASSALRLTSRRPAAAGPQKVPPNGPLFAILSGVYTKL